MATITAVVTEGPNGYNNLEQVLWPSLTETNNDGSAISNPQNSDRSVHAWGTFGGTSIALQGSNELSPVNWVPVNDPSGTAITFTTAGSAQIAENMLHYRVLLTGGTSTTVNVVMLSRRTG